MISFSVCKEFSNKRDSYVTKTTIIHLFTPNFWSLTIIAVLFF